MTSNSTRNSKLIHASESSLEKLARYVEPGGV
jgi:hypothetical protein